MTRRVIEVGSPTSREPIEIEIRGHDIDGNPVEPVVLNFLPEVQGDVFNKMAEALGRASEGSNTGGLLVLGEVSRFIRQCLPDGEESAKFEALVSSKTVIVDAQKLGAVMMALVEEYSARPSRAPSSSPVGQMPTGPTLTGAGIYQASPIPEDLAYANGSTSSMQQS